MVESEDQTSADEGAVHDAAVNGRVQLIRSAIRKSSYLVNHRDISGTTPLYKAARAQKWKVCDLLLRKAVGEIDTSQVIIALVKHELFDYDDLLKILLQCIQAGGDVNERDEEGNTPMHHAASKSAIPVLELLVQNGAKVNVYNFDKMTPLHNAVLVGQESSVTFLLGHDACSFSVNAKNETPKDLAERANYQTISQLLMHSEQNEIRNIITTEVATMETFSIRYGYSTIIYKGELYIIGGCDKANFSEATFFFGSVLVMDLMTYDIVEYQTDISIDCAGHYSSIIGKTIFSSGGVNKKGEAIKNLWALDVSNWSAKHLLTIPVNVSLNGHASIGLSRIEILFLADSSDAQYKKVVIYNAPNSEFEMIETSSKSSDHFPPSRCHYSFHRLRNLAFLFGGILPDGRVLNDMWILDLRSYEWEEVDAFGSLPPPRHSFLSTMDSSLIIMGGIGTSDDPITDKNQVYRFDADRRLWIRNFIKGTLLLDTSTPCFIEMKGDDLFFCQKQSLFAARDCFAKEQSVPTQNLGDSPLSLTLSSKGHKRKRSTSKRKSTFLTKIGRTKTDPMGHSAIEKEPQQQEMVIEEGQDVEKEGNVVAVAEKPTNAKKSMKMLLEHVGVVEDYSQTLSVDSLHFLCMLETCMKGAASEEELLLLKSTCEELEIYMSSKVDILPTSSADKLKDANRFNKGKFPYFHYQQIDVAREYTFPLPEGFEEWGSIEKSRYHIFNELLQTETLYVHDLAIIIGIYMRPLQHEFSDVVTVYEVAALFKNVEAIFDLNKKILLRLQEEQLKPCKQQDAGSVFKEFLSQIRSLYIVYSSNQILANDTFTALSKENPSFQQFYALTKSLKECKMMGLDSYLIKPFQRLCRYSLLLKELDKQTPSSWPKSVSIRAAKKEIDLVVGKANEAKRHTDDLVQVVEIQNRFTVVDSLLMQLHKYHFLREGTCKTIFRKKPKPIVLLLFQEIMIFAIPTGKKLTKYHTMPTNSIIIYNDADTKVQKHLFSVVGILDNKKITISAPSLELKLEWIGAINDAQPLDPM